MLDYVLMNCKERMELGHMPVYIKRIFPQDVPTLNISFSKAI